jgi:hypothetical protein
MTISIFFFLVSPSSYSTLKMAVQTGLDYMRSRTLVDCDTMDDEGESTGLSPGVYRRDIILPFPDR